MSLLTVKRVIRHCRALQKNGFQNETQVIDVAQHLMKELTRLHESYILLYKESQKKIRADRDPISRTRALSFQFVKDRIFQDSIRSRLIVSTNGIHNETDIRPFVLLIDEYLTELAQRVFVGIDLDDVIRDDDALEPIDYISDESSRLWDLVAEFKIRLAHAFDKVRKKNDLNYESFKEERIGELESKMKFLNSRLTNIRRGYDQLFNKAVA